ncbi:MAG: exoribonuclease R, partial [Flavobacteriaceae bacterium]
MSKRNKTRKKPNDSNLTQSILTTLRKQNSKPTNYKQIASILDVTDTTTRNLIIKTLKKLQSEDKIEEISRGKYIIKASKNYYIGKADVTSRGQAYIIVEDLEDDIFINNKNLNHTLHGDTVEVYVFKRNRGGKQEGEVT